ncbi:MAG: anti-anti-sigma factor [Opitutia bacterium Tous-C1TDCM]|nr:MAG: anti-anti-sigma factor [Opitutae bacterium Tous-C1TDCM]
MSAPASKPVFLVDPTSDPVMVRIEGRASFQNSGCLRDFFLALTARGQTRFVLDFRNCAGMDSTFLGVLAGTAIELRKGKQPSSLKVTNLTTRNLELMRNLGLHRLVTIETAPAAPAAPPPAGASPLECAPQTELESARMVLEAHETLVAADEANRAKFEDVIAFLRNRIEQP